MNRRSKIGLALLLTTAALFAGIEYQRFVAERAVRQEKEFIAELVRREPKPQLTREKLIGSEWQKAVNGGEKRIYDFAADGGVSESVILPDGSTSAPLLSWRMDGEKLILGAANRNPLAVWRYLGTERGSVYLLRDDGGVDVFEKLR